MRTPPSMCAPANQLDGKAMITDPIIKSEWRGDVLFWSINGEWVSDGALRNWCANNMRTPDRYVDVVRRCHVVAWANRESNKSRLIEAQ